MAVEARRRQGTGEREEGGEDRRGEAERGRGAHSLKVMIPTTSVKHLQVGQGPPLSFAGT